MYSKALTGLSLLMTFSLCACSPSSAHPSDIKTFEVTVDNLTNAAEHSGQPFSPPVFVTHDEAVNLWNTGDKASMNLRDIAESGNRDPMVMMLKKAGKHILSLETPLMSPLMPAQSVTVRVKVDTAHPYLSSAWMLGRTNDGFSGQTMIDLMKVSAPITYNLYGLDAGTEVNNEKAGFLPALGKGNQRDPEDLPISIHEGITGKADAPLMWNWSTNSMAAGQTPVAKVTITPINQ